MLWLHDEDAHVLDCVIRSMIAKAAWYVSIN